MPQTKIYSSLMITDPSYAHVLVYTQ